MNVLCLLNIPSSVFSQLIFLIQLIAHCLAYLLPYFAPFFLVAINTNCYSSWPTVAVPLNFKVAVFLDFKKLKQMPLLVIVDLAIERLDILFEHFEVGEKSVTLIL